MQEVTTTTVSFPSTSSQDVLTEILRQGAQAMLTTAIEAEVRRVDRANMNTSGMSEAIARWSATATCRERSITTGIGPVKIRQPRVHDRRASDEAEPFSSKILPPYLRKTRSIEELLPWLYLKGISTGDFNEALQALVGPECPGLSASTVTRLLEGWQAEYQEWSKRSLERQALRLPVGRWRPLQHPPGRRSAVHPGPDGRHGRRQEGADRHRRRLPRERAELDGTALGREVAWPRDRSQAGHRRRGAWDSGRPCRRSSRRPARSAAGSTRRPTSSTSCPSDCSHERKRRSTTSGWPTRARRPTRRSTRSWKRTARSTRRPVSAWPRIARSCSTFYDFPAEHWKHLRTTNPIESVFATVRLRHRRTKGNGSRTACLAMVHQLMHSAAKRWRLLNGSDLLPDVIAGVQFTDGVKSQEVAA